MLATTPDSPATNGPFLAATSYPNALRRFVDTTGIDCEVGPVRSGKVEGTIAQGIANAIFDIRESGRSLQENGLVVVADDDYLELGGLWRNTEAAS